MPNKKLLKLTLATLFTGLCSSVSAGIISFDVTDKAPGSLANPDYGLRLDDLFTTPTESNWTFSFDDNGAAVQMDVDTDNATVRIHGTVYGGRDVGNTWDTASTAFWELDFLYTDGITITDAVNGYWDVAYNADNYGSLELLDAVNLDGIAGTDEGRFIAIGDFHGGSFVANGGPNPAGPYVSAWLETSAGFINSKDNLASETYVRPNGGNCCMDFGFRAQPVSEPSVLILLSLSLLGFGLLPRQKA